MWDRLSSLPDDDNTASMPSFEQQLAADWPPENWQHRRVLLAISGGADSVALLRAMHVLTTRGDRQCPPQTPQDVPQAGHEVCTGGRLLVAHFNHGLRGEASQADERFVVELAKGLGIEASVGRADGSSRGSSEDALRSQRHRFLQQTAEQAGARYVVTAHTADDQVETILHRIIRGTGIGGLAGIPRTRPLGDAVVLVRPMLGITRRDVVDYLRTLDQPFREDATNAQADYTRNRIRHELLPLLARNYNPNVAEAVGRLGHLAADAQSIIGGLTDAWIDARVQIGSPDSVLVDCHGLRWADRPLLREVLTTIWKRQGWPLGEMGFAEWDRLAALALADAAQAIELPGRVRAQKKGASLGLTRLGSSRSLAT